MLMLHSLIQHSKELSVLYFLHGTVMQSHSALYYMQYCSINEHQFDLCTTTQW